MTVAEPVDDRRRSTTPRHIAVQIAWLEKQPGGQKGLAVGAGVSTKTLRNWKNGGTPRANELNAVHEHALATVPGYPQAAGVPSLVDDAPAAVESPRPDRPKRRLPRAVVAVLALVAAGLGWWAIGSRGPSPSPAAAPTNDTLAAVAETANDGNGSGTFRDHVNGVDPGPRIDPGATVEVSCRAEGLPVGNGNQWWYRIASEPWDDDWWAPADNFYNNGATSGPLADTPFIDESLPLC